MLIAQLTTTIPVFLSFAWIKITLQNCDNFFMKSNVDCTQRSYYSKELTYKVCNISIFTGKYQFGKKPDKIFLHCYLNILEKINKFFVNFFFDRLTFSLESKSVEIKLKI